jgi:hypothetical protein
MLMPGFPLNSNTPARAQDAAANGGFRPIGPQGWGAGKARAALFATLLCALFAALAGCDSTPPEQKLRDTITRMQTDGEQHRVSDVMDSVAEDFGGGGGMDRAALHRMLLGISMQNQQLGVTIGPVDVEVIGERATAKFTLGASGAAAGRFLPDRAQVYDVTTGWRLEDGEWKLISADWKDKL